MQISQLWLRKFQFQPGQTHQENSFKIVSIQMWLLWIYCRQSCETKNTHSHTYKRKEFQMSILRIQVKSTVQYEKSRKTLLQVSHYRWRLINYKKLYQRYRHQKLKSVAGSKMVTKFGPNKLIAKIRIALNNVQS